MARMSTLKLSQILAVGILGVSMSAGSVHADWPIDPGSPLVVGHAEGVFGARQSMIATDDGSVWVAWQDSFCVGSVRLQRITLSGALLAPEGIETQDDPTCGFVLPPALVSNAETVIVSRAQSSIAEYPIQGFDLQGEPQWGSGYTTQTQVALGSQTAIDESDFLFASLAPGGMIHLDRVDEKGNPIWDPPSLIDAFAGGFRLVALIPDLEGGAFVVFDSFLTYTKMVQMTRVSANGEPLWDEPIRLVGLPFDFPPSSRHSDPVACADGQGGVIFVWTKGFETGTTPAPLLMQRIDPDGSLHFPLEGIRVSQRALRQFDVQLSIDPSTGDLILVWRDGQMGETSVWAQRMRQDGTRLWGDSGVRVSPLHTQNAGFDPVWTGDELAVAIIHEDSILVHQLDGSGVPISEPWIVSSSSVAASSLVMVQSASGYVVSWQSDQPGIKDMIVAQRVNQDGRLGNPTCSAADLVGFGELDAFDVFAFIEAFVSTNDVADFTGDGVFDVFDVFQFVEVFNEGCVRTPSRMKNPPR